MNRLRGLAKRSLVVEEIGVTAALVVIVLAVGAFHPHFLTKSVLLENLQTASFTAIIGYGMVFLLAMSDLDLSVGATYAMAIIISAKLMAAGVSPWLAPIAGIGVGIVMGGLNGVLAWWFRLPLLIVTIGTLSLYEGFVTVISNGQPVENVPISASFFTILGGNILGVPAAAWVAVLGAIILTVVFTKTRFGALVRAIGSNREAAAFSGIGIDRIRLYAVMLTGGLAALSGILSLAFFQGADPAAGTDVNIQVIAAAIIGGTGVSGGRGSIPGALIGALIVTAINSGLVFFAVPSIWTDVVTGAVILGAVGSDSLFRRHRAARLTVAGHGEVEFDE